MDDGDDECEYVPQRISRPDGKDGKKEGELGKSPISKQLGLGDGLEDKKLKATLITDLQLHAEIALKNEEPDTYLLTHALPSLKSIRKNTKNEGSKQTNEVLKMVTYLLVNVAREIRLHKKKDTVASASSVADATPSDDEKLVRV